MRLWFRFFSLFFLYFSSFSGFLSFSSCQYGPQSQSLAASRSIAEKKELWRIHQKRVSHLARPLALKGKNKQARFSPDGRFILYISRDRRGHKNSQVYEMSLLSGEERRVTFQDGENRDPSYHPKGDRVIYASSTDELKEEEEWFFKEREKEKPMEVSRGIASLSGDRSFPYELYISQRDGRHIKRLTKSPDLDAKAVYHPSGDFLLFSTRRRGKVDVFKMNSRGGKPKLWSAIKEGEYWNDELNFSKDGGRLAWVRHSKSSGISHIYIAQSNTRKKTLGELKQLTTQAAQHRSPVWYPDNQHIIFSSNRASPDNFELYVMKQDGSCIHRLTYDLGDDLDPAVSPDGKKIVFTKYRPEGEQIYIMDFKVPKNCPESFVTTHPPRTFARSSGTR